MSKSPINQKSQGFAMGNMVVKNDVVIVKENAETLVKKLFDSEPCMANSNKKSMDVAVE